MKSERALYKIQSPLNGIQFVTNREIREELKPIVFFDAGSFRRNDNGFQIGFHPHSGIGIITYFHGTDLHHADSENNDGIIHDGGAQWISSGGGIWHQEAYRPTQNKAGENWKGSIHQLWVQLPPDFEESEPAYANLSKAEIPSIENVKILVGEYLGVKGQMKVPINMTYLDVSLGEGDRWEFDAPNLQNTGFVFNRNGVIRSGSVTLAQDQMGILEHKEGVIRIEAEQKADFVLIISEPSQFPIVSSGSQIHTNIDSLERSDRRIKEIGLELKASKNY
jgi:redox-sensitive bicupin YhaK (pirin superfamily)